MVRRVGVSVGLALLIAACTSSAETASDQGAQPPAIAEVEIKPIALTPRTPDWRSIEIRQERDEGFELVVLQAGVLGKGPSTYYHAIDGQLVPVGLEPGLDGDVFGVWPDDAWTIAYRHAEELRRTTVRLLKLHEGKEWATQPYAGAERFDLEDHRIRKSTRSMGGLLVTSKGVTERLAGSGEPPVVGAHRGELVEFFETREGKVYVVSKEGETFHVVIDCADQTCVSEKSRALPLTDWTFTSPIPRSSDAISVLASAAGREFVLDGGPAGWALTELSRGAYRPAGMWAAEDGGLWIQPSELPPPYQNPRDITGTIPWPADALWHRDRSGTWWTVELPYNFVRITAAVTTDQRELWILGHWRGGDLAAFATAAQKK